MQERRTPLVDEEPKHKKKSTAKGQPRSKHKHIYETVLLTKDYHFNDVTTGEPKVTQHSFPTKVCVVCGRIGDVDMNTKYYIRKPIHNLPFKCYEKELSKEAMELPRWHAEDFWDKFAIKIEF